MSGDCNFEISFHSDSDILDDSFEDPDFEPPKTALEESSTEDSEEDVVLKVLQKKKTVSRVNGNMDATTEAFSEEYQPTNSKRGVMAAAINSLKAVMPELHPDEKRDLLDIPNGELVTYLVEFFRCVVKPDKSVYNASCLGTYCNSISRFFFDKKSLDVRKDAMFSRVTKVLAHRQEESAMQGEIPGRKCF